MLVSIGLAVPVIVTYLEEGLVPRLPTAVLSMGLVILAVLSVSSGLVLDTVTRGRREVKLLAYLAQDDRHQKLTRQANLARAGRWTAPPPDAIPRLIMSDLSLTILAETASDALPIERLHRAHLRARPLRAERLPAARACRSPARPVVHGPDRHAAGRLGAAIADLHRRHAGHCCWGR